MLDNHNKTLSVILLQLIPIELEPLQRHVRAINKTLTDRLSCFYCGESATCEDHVIPHSLVCKQGTARRGWSIDTLPACKECNSILSALVFNTLDERKERLRNRLKQRYAKELAHVLWTQHELDELGSALRGYSLRMNAQHERVKQRLAVLDSELYVEGPLIASPTLEDTLTLRDRDTVSTVCAFKQPKVKPKPMFKSMYLPTLRRRQAHAAIASIRLRERIPPSNPKRWVQDSQGNWDYRLYC